MRNLRTFLIGGAAAAALAFGAAALAHTSPKTHVLNVSLPGGEVAHIQYSGDKPIVTIGSNIFPAQWMSVWSDPLWRSWDASAWSMPDFAEINASMDRRMAAMRADIAHLDRIAADPALATRASSGAGGESFCMRSIEVMQTGRAAPRIEERNLGNWSDAGGRSSGSASPARSAARA